MNKMTAQQMVAALNANNVSNSDNMNPLFAYGLTDGEMKIFCGECCIEMPDRSNIAQDNRTGLWALYSSAGQIVS